MRLSAVYRILPWLIINTAAVVRHALHDAEHHLLDIRRGIARLQLSSSRDSVG
jgi:hypothetical protein